MSQEEVQALSISALKAVLFRNHVNTGMVVEKAELVTKVLTLIADERAEREAAARVPGMLKPSQIKDEDEEL